MRTDGPPSPVRTRRRGQVTLSPHVWRHVLPPDVAYEPSDFTFYYNFLRKGATAATPDSLTWRGAGFAQRSGTAIALIRIGLLADDGSPVSVVPTGDMDDVAAGCADLIDDCARARTSACARRWLRLARRRIPQAARGSALTCSETGRCTCRPSSSGLSSASSRHCTTTLPKDFCCGWRPRPRRPAALAVGRAQRPRRRPAERCAAPRAATRNAARARRAALERGTRVDYLGPPPRAARARRAVGPRPRRRRAVPHARGAPHRPRRAAGCDARATLRARRSGSRATLRAVRDRECSRPRAHCLATDGRRRVGRRTDAAAPRGILGLGDVEQRERFCSGPVRRPRPSGRRRGRGRCGLRGRGSTART